MRVCLLPKALELSKLVRLLLGYIVLTTFQKILSKSHFVRQMMCIF